MGKAEPKLETVDQTWLKQLFKAEQVQFSGWDFSDFASSMVETPLRWNFEALVIERLTPTSRLLDLGTGGGELLMRLAHPPAQTWVTENYPPNVALLMERLAPQGVHVHVCDGAGPLPFAPNSFDVVMNRHETIDFQEVFRVLTPGGACVVQQVGHQNNFDLAKKLLGYPISHSPKTQALDAYHRAAVKAGFIIEFRDEMFPEIRFSRLETLVQFAKVIHWEFPGFSVKTCLKQLVALQESLEKTGEIVGREHRFVLALRKRGV